jgi:hypothetical protein
MQPGAGHVPTHPFTLQVQLLVVITMSAVYLCVELAVGVPADGVGAVLRFVRYRNEIWDGHIATIPGRTHPPELLPAYPVDHAPMAEVMRPFYRVKGAITGPVAPGATGCQLRGGRSMTSTYMIRLSTTSRTSMPGRSGLSPTFRWSGP